MEQIILLKCNCLFKWKWRRIISDLIMLLPLSFRPFNVARNGLPASEPWGFVEASCCFCPSVFCSEEQGYKELWESNGLFGRHLQAPARTGGSNKTHEDHVWLEDNGMVVSCGAVLFFSKHVGSWVCFFKVNSFCAFCFPPCPSHLFSSPSCGCSESAKEWLTQCLKSTSSFQANYLNTKASVWVSSAWFRCSGYFFHLWKI